MHADALAARDKTTDRIGRRRLAALGQLGHQRVNPHHQQATLGRLRCAARLAQQRQVGLSDEFFGRSQQQLDVAQRKLILAHHLEQIVGCIEAQLGRQVVLLEGGAALALQQFFDCLAALGNRLVQRLGIEPGPHLSPGPVAHQVAQLGIEPIARGAALLGHGHLHGLAIFQRRVQRHHDTVEPGATAAVAQVGVQAVGKIDRSSPLRQLHNGSLGCQHINAVVKRAGARRAGELALPGQQLAQHRDLGVIGAGG